MRVLIGQESSGVIRCAFAERGHFAVSVDLLPADDGCKAWGTSNYSRGWHYQGDIMDFIYGDAGGMMDAGFDLAIFHPDCTNLTNAGIRWLYFEGRKANGPDPQRWHAMERDAKHYRRLKRAPIKRIAVENPRMHPYGEARCGIIKPRQFVQPYHFGDNETKATGLELINLPELALTYADYEAFRIATGLPAGSKPVPRVHHASPGPNRWKERSRTLPGIANAMAEQWGSL
jgi:hypothetical protein